MFQHKEAFPKAVWLPSSIAAPFEELIFPKMSVTPPESLSRWTMQATLTQPTSCQQPRAGLPHSSLLHANTFLVSFPEHLWCSLRARRRSRLQQGCSRQSHSCGDAQWLRAQPLERGSSALSRSHCPSIRFHFFICEVGTIKVYNSRGYRKS